MLFLLSTLCTVLVFYPNLEMTEHSLEFSESQMVSDPEPKRADIIIVEHEENSVAKPDQNRAQAWFDSNKVTRVPVIALGEDLYKVPNQNFVCFSIIKPEDYGVLHHGEDKYTGSLIKFRGVFNTREEADKHIRKVMKADPHFDVHLVPAGTWARTEDSSVGEREYVDSDIADMMKGYFKEENNRMKGVSRRIQATQDDDKDEDGRSTEVSKFFRESQDALEDTASSALEMPKNAKPLTLTELAERLEIKPSGSTIMTQDMDNISAERMEALVSEIILED